MVFERRCKAAFDAMLAQARADYEAEKLELLQVCHADTTLRQAGGRGRRPQAGHGRPYRPLYPSSDSICGVVQEADGVLRRYGEEVSRQHQVSHHPCNVTGSVTLWPWRSSTSS